MRLGESYKTEIYLIVSIIGHMKTCFPVCRSKDLLEIQDCLRRAIKLVRSERPSNRLTVNDALFSLKGLVSAVWPSIEMPSRLLTARLRNTPSVLFHVMLTISLLAKTADAKYWPISEMPEKWQRFASFNLLECPWPHDVVFVTIQTLGSGLADSSNYLSTTAVFS